MTTSFLPFQTCVIYIFQLCLLYPIPLCSNMRYRPSPTLSTLRYPSLFRHALSTFSNVVYSVHLLARLQYPNTMKRQAQFYALKRPSITFLEGSYLSLELISKTCSVFLTHVIVAIILKMKIFLIMFLIMFQ